MQDRVAAEVAALPDRPMTPEDIPQLGYTVQVVRESLRLCPPAPTGTRMAQRDVSVDGYLVQKGTMLVVGHRPFNEIPRCGMTRFIRSGAVQPGKVQGLDRWQYIPFGGGPRSCIGDHFAMLEVTLALASIIRQTEIHSIDPDFPMIVPFTTVAAEPIRARVNDSSHAEGSAPLQI